MSQILLDSTSRGVTTLCPDGSSQVLVGTVANDGTGDGARVGVNRIKQWAADLNTMLAALYAVTNTTPISVTFDGGGVAPAVGSVAYKYVPYAATIKSATILADASGSATIGVSACLQSSFPGSLASIVASAVPTLTAAQTSQDSTLTGWTNAIPAGSVLAFTLLTASGALTRLNLSLQI